MTLTTYDPLFVNQAESAEDAINAIDELVTPFFSSVSKVPGGNGEGAKKESWFQRAYRAAKDNAKLEAEMAPATTSILPTELENYHQIFADTASVSRSSEKVKSYGITNLLTDQIQQNISGQMLDVEKAMVGLFTEIAVDGNAVNPTDATAFKDTTRKAGYENSGTVAGRMASIHGLIDTSLHFENGGTPRDLTEQLVINALTGIYNATKRIQDRVCLVKAADMFVTAEFANKPDGSRIRDSAGRTVLVNYVKRYVTPYGTVTFVPDTEIAPESAIIYDPAMTDCIELAPIDFGKVSSGTIRVAKTEISGEMTLALRNAFSAAYIGDLR